MPALLGRGLVVDLRSSDYAAMWRPRGDDARPNGRRPGAVALPPVARGVVSYPSKFAKGG